MLNFEITHRQLGLESIKGNLHALLVISLVCERTYQKYFSKLQRLSDLLLLLSKFSFSFSPTKMSQFGVLRIQQMQSNVDLRP